jgi:hypothetical protein
MSVLGKRELICHGVVITLITLLYVVLGLVLLFGPADVRLARNAGTLVPAFAWAIASWFLYCGAWAVLCRIIFFILEKRSKPGQISR